MRRRGFPVQNKTFTSKTDAATWARQVESEMDRGVFVSRVEAERTTLGEALERYWREHASHKRCPKRGRGFIDRWLHHPYAKRFLASLRSAEWQVPR
ncbi:MAG: integrase [Rhodocyclales bacterium]|nr:integrase [Rhodocyclales bacterium]